MAPEAASAAIIRSGRMPLSETLTSGGDAVFAFDSMNRLYRSGAAAERADICGAPPYPVILNGSMIPKSGHRFSEKIMLKQRAKASRITGSA